MDHHYFYVQKRGLFYIAAISTKEPKGDEIPERELVLGRVHVNCVLTPNELRAWADMMSKLTDNFVNGAFARAGMENSVGDTETLLDVIPKTN